MTGEKIELIERHARIDRLKGSVKKLEKRAKYLFTVHKIKNAKSEAQIQRVEEKEEKKRKLADLEIIFKEQNAKRQKAVYLKEKSSRLLSSTIIFGPIIIISLQFIFFFAFRSSELNLLIYSYSKYIWYLWYGVILVRVVEFLIYENEEQLIKNSLEIIQNEIDRLAPIIKP